jgi:predicted nuclease of restriction endonuclease-like (RecB) superfamily
MSELRQNNPDFSEVLRIIHTGRAPAFQAVNTTLIDTYWAVGEYLSRKVAEAGWGKGIVKELAGWLAAQAPEVKGFSSQNLWRMKQFYEVYSSHEKLSALPRVLTWTHYCTLLSQCKTPEERYFYAISCERAGWSTREMEEQIRRGAFERTLLADKKLSALLVRHLRSAVK